MNIILIGKGERFFPSGDERAKHIRKVLRLGKGDSFRAGEVDGLAGMATILFDGDDGISFSFEGSEDRSALYPLTLIVAQVRPICMRRILREAVSLGVGRMILPVSDLGEKSYLGASLYTEGAGCAIPSQRISRWESPSRAKYTRRAPGGSAASICSLHSTARMAPASR